MNGQELAKLHEDVKELTIEVREFTVRVGHYIEHSKDHETRIRGLEKGEKKITIISSVIAAIISGAGLFWAYLKGG
jgi:hypothetical protein